MKDLYSFHTDNEGDFEKYYSRVQEAYKNIFRRAGIGEVTFLTYAAGGSFSKYSHEFQTLTPAGEDTIYLCEKCGIAINDEIIVAQTSCPECGLDKERLRKERAVEVGNIFPLKTKFTEAFGVTYKDKDGAAKLVVMGCYGIGLGRLMGAIVEVHADEQGLSWPVEVAPFQMHLIYVGNENGEAKKKADTLYEELKSVGIEVLYDDRDMSAGVKFSDAELIGIPQMVIVGEKTLETGKFEVRTRGSGEVFFKDAKELFQIVA